MQGFTVCFSHCYQSSLYQNKDPSGRAALTRLPHRFRPEVQESATFYFWHRAPIVVIWIFPVIKITVILQVCCLHL